MTGREKVMQWLETCVSGCEEGCPYEYKNLVYRVECKADLMRDALAMLKEQEPVKAVADGEDSYMCNNCGTVIGWAEWEPGGIEEVKYKFCPECGRAVEWDA